MIKNYTQQLILAGLFTLLALGAAAQQKPVKPRKQPQHWDVLYLKNGSVIKGTIIDSSAAGVKLENRIQDTLVYSAQEVERITRVPRPLKISRKGFYGIMVLVNQLPSHPLLKDAVADCCLACPCSIALAICGK